MKYKSYLKRKRLLWILGLLVCFHGIYLFGCKSLHFFGDFIKDTKLTGIIFDHKQHLGRGFTCGVCHQLLSYYDPKRPPERVCLFCHEIGDHDEPTEECAQCHTRLDFTAEGVPRLTFKDNKFQHEQHIKADISCQKCHKKQVKAKVYKNIVFPAMKACNSCHAKMGLERECENCHQVWREDIKPDNHNNIWEKVHGGYAVDTFETNCDYCHSYKMFCQDCHMTSPPRSHTLFFRNRGHGFWAEIERMSCLPCHQQDFCMECHGPGSEVKPRSHTGGFGGRRPYLHCTNCHFPSGAIYGCIACHNAGTIQMKHREATEERSDPIPEFVLETSRNCLNACHPFLEKPFNHPIGALNNNDCLRCHSP